MNLVAIVLGADNSNDRFETASYLLDYGFANYKIVKPEIDDSQINNVTVKFGSLKEFKPTVKDNLKICIDKNSEDLTYEYEIDKIINAPVEKGQVVGKIKVLSKNAELCTIDLICDKQIFKLTLKDVIKHLFIKI